MARRRHAASPIPLLTALKQAFTAPTAPVILGVPTELAVGFVAGVASRAVSTPLGVLTVRLQSSSEDDAEGEMDEESLPQEKTRRTRKERRGLKDVARSIYAEQGILGFWAGFSPTLPLCLTPALTLLLFQLLRHLRPALLSTSPISDSIRAFVDGACANALALAALYPLVLTKVRVQVWRQARGSDGAGTGGGVAPAMFDVWRTACAEGGGWLGLYDGLGVQLVKGFVSQG